MKLRGEKFGEYDPGAERIGEIIRERDALKTEVEEAHRLIQRQFDRAEAAEAELEAVKRAVHEAHKQGYLEGLRAAREEQDC